MSRDASMTERDVTVNSVSLRCVTWGTRAGDRPPVLLIHGLTSHSGAWATLGPLLASHGFYVIAADLRGRGHSDKPPHGYSIPIHASDLLSLCDAFDVSLAQVVGHSLGAQIGIYLAALYPERVDRLTVIDAGGSFPPDTMEAISASLARLDTVYSSLEGYLEAMSRSPLHPWSSFWERYYRYDALVHADGTVTSRVPRSAIEEEVRALDAMRLDALPDRVRVPTLIVHATVGLLGLDRGLVLPPSQAARLGDAIPDSTVLAIPDTNHYTILLSSGLECAVPDFVRRAAAV